MTGVRVHDFQVRLRQRALRVASGHRGENGHPFGMSTSDGGLP